MGTKQSMWFVILTVFPLLRSVRSFEYQIQASVMGRLGSREAELYANISEILLREKGYPDRHAFCSISFNQLMFDTTNGSTVYSSLTRARTNFDNTRKAVAIGPAIDVFTSTDYVILNQLHLLTSNSGLDPHMTSSGKKVVSIFPDPESLSDAVARIVHELGWREVALLAEDDFGPVLSLSRLDITVWPIRLPRQIMSQDDAELIRNLVQLRASQRKKFILHSTRRSNVMHVIEAANRVQLLHHSLDWFITYPDFEDLLDSSGEDQWPGSLYGLQLLHKDKIPKNISSKVGLPGEAMSRLDLAMAVDVVGLLRHVLWHAAPDCSREPLQNTIVDSRDFERIVLTRSQEDRYDGALGLYAWHQGTQVRTNYSVDILWFKNQRKRRVGTVTYEESEPVLKLNLTEEEKEEPVQQVFGKDELKIVYQLADPFVMRRKDGEFEGFTVDLVQELARKLNFQFQLVEAPNRNGVDNGMIQELMAGNASLAIGALDVSAAREELISFSFTILSTKASLLIKRAESGQNFFQFLGPFSTGLWFMILGFLMVAAASLYLMGRFDQTQRGSEQRFDLKESTWYSINIILQGTTEYSPQTTSMRTIIAFFWFCVLIIDAAYTANLAAYLTLQQMDNRIRSVRELADQNTIMYGVQRGSSLEAFFENQTTDPYERMWTFMKINSDKALVSEREEIIGRVLSGTYVHIADGVVNNYYAGEQCGVEAVDQEFGGKSFSLGLPRGAPYKDDVNRALLKLKEEGILDQLQEKWWSPSRNCSAVADKGSASNKATAELEIANMFGVFIVLVALTILAIIVEIVERVTKCVQRRKKEVDAAQL